MPFYTFRCDKCISLKKRLLNLDKAKYHSEPCDACSDGVLRYTMPKPNSVAKETLDEYRGKSVEMDLTKKLEDRSREHFKKSDLPRLIEEHGTEFGIRNGWLNEDGTVKE